MCFWGVTNDRCDERDDEYDDLEPEEDLDENVTIMGTDLPTIDTDSLRVVTTTTRRTHGAAAILHACGQSNTSEERQKKTMFILDTLSLHPFAIIDKHGTEHNALAHPSVINKAITTSASIESVMPAKRSFEDMTGANPLCISCSPTIHADLANLISTSSYSKLLQQRQFVELPPDVCQLLNQDWTFHPQVKFFSSQVLAGSILWNTLNGQAVMLNTIEIYGRTKHVDIRRESFGTKKHNALPTSLPPPVPTLYPDVWPVTLQKSDGTKLLISTQVSNALATSTIRLDTKEPPTVGSTTLNFQLTSKQDSFACRIFIDCDSLRSAMAMIDNSNTTSFSNPHILYQLRQITTNISSPSAYVLCRTSGFITKSHSCQPYTIFTLADYDRGRNPCAKLFRLLAILVLKYGIDARLYKKDVLELWSASAGKMKSMLDNILALFDDDTNITILNNKDLDTHLQQLAVQLMPYIVSANKSIEDHIVQVFSCLD